MATTSTASSEPTATEPLARISLRTPTSGHAAAIRSRQRASSLGGLARRPAASADRRAGGPGR